MDRFHVNLKTGKVGPCDASEGNCPFKGDAAHASTADEARGIYERHIAQDDDPETNSHVSLRKTTSPLGSVDAELTPAFSQDVKNVLAKIDQAEADFNRSKSFSSKLLGAIGHRLDLTAFGVSEEKADEADKAHFDVERDANLTAQERETLMHLRSLKGEVREKATRGMTVSKVNYVEREGLARLPGNTLSLGASIADNISEGKNISDWKKIEKAAEEAEEKLFEKLGVANSPWI